MNKEQVATIQKANDLFHENKAVRDLSAELSRYEMIMIDVGATPRWCLFVSQFNMLLTLGQANMLTDDEHVQYALDCCNAIIERSLKEKQMKDLAKCCGEYLGEYLLPKMGTA